MRAHAYLLRLVAFGFITLMLFSLCLLNPVRADPGAILKISLPDGSYVGADPDPWLSECWLLNLTGTSQTFTVRINDTSTAKRSYDTRLIIAMNDNGYNNLENLVVNATSVPKSAFRHGTPTPYNLWTWPSGDVYPTWFNDTSVNVGTVPRKGYIEVVVSVTFSNATGIRMHFDAYGSSVSSPPTKVGDITHNGISEDSTVLFQVGPSVLQPPIANFFYYPSYPNTAEMVIFNASKSYDPDGSIVSYSWNFGDGTPTVVESNPIANHTYTSFNNYTVTLTVADNDGLTDNSTVTISVRQHPVAAFTFSPPDPLLHEIVTFDASSSTADGGVIISYEWNFGDGNITAVTSPIINYTYSTFGNYTVTLNVTDSEGKWDMESKPITVEALPIADFWWSPQYPTVCENVTFDASDSTPDGGILVTYAWNFGDGTPIVIESGPITTYHYTVNGSLTVTLNITDSEGRWDTESKIITISPCRYYLTVKTDPASVTTISGEGWYNESENVLLTAPECVNVSTGTRYTFTYWDINRTSQGVGVNSITVYIDSNYTATAHYILQHYLTVISPHNSPTPTSGWYDDGASITASVTSPTPGSPGTRYMCIGWTGTGSVPAAGTTCSVSFTITDPSSITWNWKTQYYLTVKTEPPGIATIPGEGWYDESTNVPLTAPSIAGRYSFVYWDVNGVSQGVGVESISVIMNAPYTATANYKHVVGGSTVSIKSPLLHIWVSLNAVIIAAISATASLVKRRQRKKN